MSTRRAAELMLLKKVIFKKQLKAYKFIQNDLCVLGDIIFMGNQDNYTRKSSGESNKFGSRSTSWNCMHEADFTHRSLVAEIDRAEGKVCKTCRGCLITSSLSPADPLEPREHLGIDFQRPLPTTQFIGGS